MPPPAGPGPRSGDQRSKRDSNRRISPSAPSEISFRTVRKSESQRRFWYTVSGTPAASAAAVTSRADSASSAYGLSTTTARPCRIASWARSAWVAAGVETLTASTPAAAMSAIESNAARPSGSSARRCGEVVTTPTKSISAVAAISGAWKIRPPEPYPTSPYRTASAMR